MKNLLYLLFVLPLLSSCGVDNASSNEKSVKEGPNRRTMILTLNDLMGHLQNKEFDKAKTYFILPKGVSSERVTNMLSELIPKKEISQIGINALENEKFFQFGELNEVYGDKGAKMAKRAGLDPSKCYGIYCEGTNLEVMAMWDEKRFKFFRIDNLGRIPANWQEKL